MRCLFVVLSFWLLFGSIGGVHANFAPSNVFAGRWAGTLEYQDHQSSKRVSLPTTLMILPASDGTALIYHYLYDGPGKQVQETETVTIDLASATYSVLADGDKKSTVYHMTGLADFVRDSRGLLVLTGSGKDGDKPADFRKTIYVMGETMTILTETRLPGGAFQFRSQYTLTHLLMPEVSPGGGLAWRKAEEDALREATFRYLFVAFPPDGDWHPKMYYLAMQPFPWDQETESDKASDTAFLKRFRNNTPPVGNVFVLTGNKDWDKQARHQWIIYGVGSDITWRDDTVIDIGAGRSVSGYYGPRDRGGRGIILICTLRNGWWEISTVSAPDF